MIKNIGILSLILFLVSCQGGENSPNIELIQDMMDGPQIKTQEGIDGDKISMRTPPKGTIPRGFKPYIYDKFDVEAANSLKSPVASMSIEDLKNFEETGKEKFRIYCGICHGTEGKGNGSVADKMIKRPPDLTIDTYKSYSDGQIFNVVTNGFGLMGGYMSQIPNEVDRWAIVEHLRKLQDKPKKGGN